MRQQHVKSKLIPVCALKDGIKYRRGLKIGLYGGSFDPAHTGHVRVSQAAIAALGLDQIWWLVTPGNPLKDLPDLSVTDRICGARASIGQDRRIRVTDIETILGTRYTVDTIFQVKTLYPDHMFVWIMGADQLLGFLKWHQWFLIPDLIPIAVFNRPGYGHRSLASHVSHKLSRFRLDTKSGRRLVMASPPAWGFFWQTSSRCASRDLRRIRGDRGDMKGNQDE